jgi:hypothetical protein
MTTTVEPYKGRQRRDCQKCFGEVRYVLRKPGVKKPVGFVCVWCARPYKAAA